MKSIKELADVCQERAMHYGGLEEDSVLNNDLFGKWQRLSDTLKQVGLLIEDLDDQEVLHITEKANYDIGQRLRPLEGYDFGLHQGTCSAMWYWYIRSRVYGQVLFQNANGFVDRDDCLHNLDLVRRAFMEEQTNANT